jgi:predicted nucleic acid-binding protein
MILVDTSIWVRSLRRNFPRERQVVADLIDRDLIATTDIVVAEVLQGARSEADFQELADKMGALNFFHADEGAWLNAAKLSFELRRRGLTTALSDLVIATVALEHNLEVYSVDSDFERVTNLQLYQPVA